MKPGQEDQWLLILELLEQYLDIRYTDCSTVTEVEQCNVVLAEIIVTVLEEDVDISDGKPAVTIETVEVAVIAGVQCRTVTDDNNAFNLLGAVARFARRELVRR